MKPLLPKTIYLNFTSKDVKGNYTFLCVDIQKIFNIYTLMYGRSQIMEIQK